MVSNSDIICFSDSPGGSIFHASLVIESVYEIYIYDYWQTTTNICSHSYRKKVWVKYLSVDVLSYNDLKLQTTIAILKL